MPPPSDPRNLRAKWQRALEERRKAGAAAPPLDVTPRPPRKGEAAPAPPRTSEEDAAGAGPGTSGAPRDGSPATLDDAPATAGAAGDRPAAEARAPGARGHRLAAAGGKPGADPDKPTAESDSPAAPAPAAALGPRRVEPEGPKMVVPVDEDDPEKKEKKAEPPGSPWGAIVAALVLVGGVGLALRTFLSNDDPANDPRDDDPALAASGDPSADPSGTAADPAAKPPAKPRCTAPAAEPFVIGDAPAPKPAAPDGEGDDAHEDELAPFAVELGRGVHFDQGFAVGTQRQAEGGTVAMVAVLGDDGGDGRLVRLARSRGDLDPPVVAAAGNAILAAMMEPNAGGRSIRVAKVEGDHVTWGPELSEGRDESLAVDIAAAGAQAMVVWDDVPLGRERSVIELATFDVGAMRGSGARPVTPPNIDADTPRLAPRPGGFWLSYLVHGEAPTTPTAEAEDDDDAAPGDTGPASKKPGGKRDAPSNPDDSDTEAAGEAIAAQWIELVPLDASGFPTGAPRAVTPKEGRVIGYDLDDGEDGRAVVLYREDDTPSGSTGGLVKAVVAELGGVSEPRVIAEEGVGTGVPMLYGGWVVIHSLAGPAQLGAIGPRGDLVGELSRETSLKLGEILSAHGDAFLVATPAGRAMKLGVVRCTR